LGTTLINKNETGGENDADDGETKTVTVMKPVKKQPQDGKSKDSEEEEETVTVVKTIKKSKTTKVSSTGGNSKQSSGNATSEAKPTSSSKQNPKEAETKKSTENEENVSVENNEHGRIQTPSNNASTTERSVFFGNDTGESSNYTRPIVKDGRNNDSLRNDLKTGPFVSPNHSEPEILPGSSKPTEIKKAQEKTSSNDPLHGNIILQTIETIAFFPGFNTNQS